MAGSGGKRLMPLKISLRKESDVPRPTAAGKVNAELEELKSRMASLPAGMVLEIEATGGRTVRGTKAMVTRAARALGTTWRHWDAGNKVYAQPARRRRRRRTTAAKAR
jgi:hypothetical protein